MPFLTAVLAEYIPRADPHLIAAITRGYAYGPPVYFLTFVLAFISVGAASR